MRAERCIIVDTLASATCEPDGCHDDDSAAALASFSSFLGVLEKAPCITDSVTVHAKEVKATKGMRRWRGTNVKLMNCAGIQIDQHAFQQSKHSAL